KSLIASAQEERERLNLLVSEYVGVETGGGSDRKTKTWSEIICRLTLRLFNAMDAQHPSSDELFAGSTENTAEGFHRLFTCYEIGRTRLHSIYLQDVVKSVPRNTTG